MQYSKIVMDHFKNPHNQGVISDANGVGETGNPMCGDMMKVYIKVKDQKIEDIKFETLGCAAAIACSSILTDMAKGKTLKEARKIGKSEIVSQLGDLPTTKIHCSVLAHEALAKAIDDYNNKNLTK